MSREIKFRGLDRNDGLVKTIEQIDFKNELVLFVGEDAWVDFSNTEIMQFTGLHDKNGVEIYEGDIVSVHQFLFDGNEYENELVGEVIYNDELTSFCITKIKNHEILKYMGYEINEENNEVIPIYNIYGLHEESFEVIGNIHERSEDNDK